MASYTKLTTYKTIVHGQEVEVVVYPYAGPEIMEESNKVYTYLDEDVIFKKYREDKDPTPVDELIKEVNFGEDETEEEGED